MDGVKEGKHDEVLYKPYSTKVWVDVALHFWRYADFKLEYTLAQQFNYEYTILQTAWIRNANTLCASGMCFLTRTA